LLQVAFLLVNSPNCHLFPVLASVVQGDAVNCNSVNILCPADPSVKAKSQVYLSASCGKLILKMQHSTTRQAKQKISANLDHH